MLEKIHLAGYSYNNIKLENIIIGNHNCNLNEAREIRLVDFKNAKKNQDFSNDLKSLASGLVFLLEGGNQTLANLSI